jgi:FMN phosphatase YigB (HAD superfamily)
MVAIGVSFDRAIVAGEIGSYKPALGHWRAFENEVGRLPDVHVAASLFHDVAPTTELGIPCFWVNRLGESTDGYAPARELRTLNGLAEALDDLVAT